MASKVCLTGVWSFARVMDADDGSGHHRISFKDVTWSLYRGSNSTPPRDFPALKYGDIPAAIETRALLRRSMAVPTSSMVADRLLRLRSLPCSTRRASMACMAEANVYGVAILRRCVHLPSASEMMMVLIAY